MRVIFVFFIGGCFLGDVLFKVMFFVCFDVRVKGLVFYFEFGIIIKGYLVEVIIYYLLRFNLNLYYGLIFIFK